MSALIALVPIFAVGQAWGCVPQPLLVTLDPGSFGPPGSEVRVDGLGFDPDAVEVRWATSEGTELGRANGPNFSVTVKVPDVPAGLYAIVVLARERNGSVGNTRTVAFQVTAPGSGAASSGAAPAPAPAAPEEKGTSTDTGVVALAAAGGASLVLLGGLGGMALGRRRIPQKD